MRRCHGCKGRWDCSNGRTCKQCEAKHKNCMKSINAIKVTCVKYLRDTCKSQLVNRSMRMNDREE